MIISSINIAIAQQVSYLIENGAFIADETVLLTTLSSDLYVRRLCIGYFSNDPYRVAAVKDFAAIFIKALANEFPLRTFPKHFRLYKNKG